MPTFPLVDSILFLDIAHHGLKPENILCEKVDEAVMKEC